jgi:hypothetical protein
VAGTRTLRDCDPHQTWSFSRPASGWSSKPIAANESSVGSGINVLCFLPGLILYIQTISPLCHSPQNINFLFQTLIIAVASTISIPQPPAKFLDVWKLSAIVIFPILSFIYLISSFFYTTPNRNEQLGDWTVLITMIANTIVYCSLLSVSCMLAVSAAPPDSPPAKIIDRFLLRTSTEKDTLPSHCYLRGGDPHSILT